MSMDRPDPGARPGAPAMATTAPEASATTGEKAEQVASTASEEATRVKESATAGSKQVAGDASAQASAVVDQTKQQISSVVDQAKGELQTQVDAQGEQAAGALSKLSNQLTALGDGRPHESGPLAGLVSEAQTKVQAYADRLQDAGPQGVIDDLASFARRRPGLFLLGAGAAGFAVGRVVRSGAAAAKDDGDAAASSDQLTGTLDELPAPVPGDVPAGATPATTGVGATGVGATGVGAPPQPMPSGAP